MGGGGWLNTDAASPVGPEGIAQHDRCQRQLQPVSHRREGRMGNLLRRREEVPRDQLPDLHGPVAGAQAHQAASERQRPRTCFEQASYLSPRGDRHAGALEDLSRSQAGGQLVF